VLVVSGRLSARSLANYRVFPGMGLMRSTLGCVTAVEAQTAEDASRFKAAGLPPDRVTVSGNLKFDYKPDTGVIEAGRVLRSGWGRSTRPVWIAASTHAGEEALALEAQAELLQSFPELLLVLVPRHPQRFEEVAQLCRDSRLRTARRGKSETCGDDTCVLLADTLGELVQLYAAADVAFVGGSLVPVGGHNLLEPASLGLPVITGPYLKNQKQMAELLQTEGAASVVNDRPGLVGKLAELLDSPTMRHQAGLAGRHVIEQNQGALGRVLKRVEQFLSPPGHL
jgi:3-deoxy-D-manno-octulosonic-acid transferase